MIRRFAAYYRPYRGLFLLDFGSAVLLAGLELLFPVAVKWVVDTLLPAGHWETVLQAGAGLLLLYGVTAGLSYIVLYYGHKLGISIEYDMRQQLFDHVQRLSFRFFDTNKTGATMSRLVHDLFEIGELAHHGPEEIFIAAMTFAGSAAIMLAMNWQLAMVVIVAAPLMVWLVAVFQQRLERAALQMARDVAEVNAQAEDTLSGIRVVQAFTNEAHESAKFRRSNRLYRDAKLRSYRIIAQNASRIHLLTRLLGLVVLLAGGWLALRGDLSLGTLFGFMLMSNIFVHAIDRINLMMEVLTKGTAGFRRLTELLDEQPDLADAPGAVTAPPFRGEIAFDDVRFSYEGQETVFHSLNLRIAAGETVALVGPSGAGKTTLASLIPRFYEVDAGRITIDGADIRSFTLRSLRGQIGLVQQDVFLFNGTLRENIAYGRVGASDGDIWRAAEQAQLGDFLATLPDGLDTLVGERGTRLSGGQRQRIAIARIFLKDPPILILDEATSALDAATEVAIQQALQRLAAGRTTLIIAHRLATVRQADRIFVVTEQGVAEEGAHAELVARGGVYASLVRLQLEGVAP